MQILREFQRFVGRKLYGWDDGMKTSKGVGDGRCSDLRNQRSGDWIFKLACAFCGSEACMLDHLFPVTFV